MSLLPHQQRVIEERDEVQGRIEKLAVFLNSPAFGALCPAEQERLTRQSVIMVEYSDVLSERIEAFTPTGAAA